MLVYLLDDPNLRLAGTDIHEGPPDGFVTLSAFSFGECSGQQASCGGGCRDPSAE